MNIRDWIKPESAEHIDNAELMAKQIRDNTFDFYELRITFDVFKKRNRSLWRQAIRMDVDGAVAFLLRPQMR